MTTTTITCDRCGAAIPADQRTRRIVAVCDSATSVLDLCRECQDELYVWVKTGKTTD